MSEVVINDKLKTHEEGKHTYIGKYKGKDFKASMQDMNNNRELVYMVGEDNFTIEDKDVIFEQLDDMVYVDSIEERQNRMKITIPIDIMGRLIPTNYTNSPRKKKKKLRKEAEKEIEKIISDRIKKLTE
jgi:hypothetical protein